MIMLSKFRKSEKGFTLIELLIVVAIIGILAAIAIPQFSQYRQRAFDAAAQSDVRTMRTDLEGYFTDQYQAVPKNGYTKLFEKLLVGDSEAKHQLEQVVKNTTADQYGNGI
jgi:prepilin-type N-terminal cleavage/methylation domain-containing protein